MSADKAIKIHFVIPCRKEDKIRYIFVRRQVDNLSSEEAIDLKVFFLENRTNPFKLFSSLISFIGEIKSSGTTIIHAQYGSINALFCAIASILTGTRLIITFMGSDVNVTPSNDGFLRDLFGRVASNISLLRASYIVAVSAGLKDMLWWKRESVQVIPTEIDVSIFYPIPKEEARKKLGWEMSRQVVVFNQGFSPVTKRVGLAKESIALAKKEAGEIDLQIFDGSVDPASIPLYLNAACCLLVTSSREGSPNIVKEALACNLPIVTVDVGDVRERMENVYPSRIVGDKKEEIASAVVEILKKRVRSNGFSAACLVDKKRIVKQLVSVYREVIKN